MSTSSIALTTVSNYINGEWTEPGTSEWLDVVNPATQEVIGRSLSSGPDEVNAAVAAAAAAFPACWAPAESASVIQMVRPTTLDNLRAEVIEAVLISTLKGAHGGAWLGLFATT